MKKSIKNSSNDWHEEQLEVYQTPFPDFYSSLNSQNNRTLKLELNKSRLINQTFLNLNIY